MSQINVIRYLGKIVNYSILNCANYSEYCIVSNCVTTYPLWVTHTYSTCQFLLAPFPGAPSSRLHVLCKTIFIIFIDFDTAKPSSILSSSSSLSFSFCNSHNFFFLSPFLSSSLTGPLSSLHLLARIVYLCLFT